MGYNDNDISTLKGAIDGPIFWSPTEYLGTFDEDFDPIAAGFVYLGEVSADGIDTAQSADSTDISVWSGRIVRKVFSNWQDTLVLRLASILDADVARALYGEDRVFVNGNTIKVLHGLRQPKVGALFVKAVTDDNREHWLLGRKAQADINGSETWSATELVVKESTWNLLPASDGMTHETLTVGNAS